MKKIKRAILKARWNINNYLKKTEHLWRPKKNILISFFKVLFFLFCYILSLYLLKVIKFDFTTFKILILKINYSKTYNDLVIAQIGSTFLTTAILSLISSVEDKKILGEKVTDVLFGKKLLKFKIPIFILYFSMVINIILMLTKSNSNYVIALFILSIFNLIYIVTKVGNIFLSTKKYVLNLYANYYKEAEKTIINNIPPKDYNSPLLVSLKEETIKLISDNDKSYIKNINMYEVIIDRLLFNIPKKVQKYHIHMHYAPSIINDFVEIIEHFIYFDDTTRAMQYYNWLLSRFNFHNIYIPFSHMNDLYKDLCNKLNNFKSEYELKSYLRYLSPIITAIEIQQHYAMKNDYSYTGFNSLIIDHIYQYNCKYFELIYDNIHNNKYLSEREKIDCYTELFEMFRMSAHNGCNIIRDITNFSFEYKTPEERNMSPCIVGQATALLLLKTILYKDERSFKLFSEMNIEAEEMCFAIHSLLLSLIKMEINREDINIYNDFYGIDLKYGKKFLSRQLNTILSRKLWDGKTIKDHMQKSYEYIHKECVDRDNLNNQLFLEYIFKYDEELVNEYFSKLCLKNSLKIKIYNKKKKNYSKVINTYIKS